MYWTNYHTHCRFCDGMGEPSEYAVAAEEQRVMRLGFSSHAPLPWKTDWTMDPADLEAYVEAVERLKDDPMFHTQVFCGLEIDFIPEVDWAPRAGQFPSVALDYIIGSIHFCGVFDSGEHWSIDDGADEFARGVETLFGGEPRRAVEAYYARLRDMVRVAPPDVLAHIDVVKKNNVRLAPGESRRRYFQEDEPWYVAAVEETLEAIAASPSIVEVNTGGLARGRCDDLYPSRWILERCHALGAPVTLSADGHRTDELTALFPETAALLREIGFETLRILGEDGWTDHPFSADGVVLDETVDAED